MPAAAKAMTCPSSVPAAVRPQASHHAKSPLPCPITSSRGQAPHWSAQTRQLAAAAPRRVVSTQSRCLGRKALAQALHHRHQHLGWTGSQRALGAVPTQHPHRRDPWMPRATTCRQRFGNCCSSTSSTITVHAPKWAQCDHSSQKRRMGRSFLPGQLGSIPTNLLRSRLRIQSQVGTVAPALKTCT